MVRPEAIRERLLRLEEVISRLEELRLAAPAASPGSFRDAWASERGLLPRSDVGKNHILSAHFGVAAQLGAHGVIDAGLRERLRGLGGFGNVLVHGYLRVDRARVAELLARAPADFSELASAVRAWFARTLG